MSSILEVEGLSFSFEPERPILRGISFRLSPGERLGIVGGNGAGKSTLLWCLTGLLRCSGSIRLFGEELSKKSLERVGMVFQNPDDQLFMPTLRDDLMLSLVNRGMTRSEARCAALKSLEELGISALAERSAARLSMGERKRAAIAAALSTQPGLLLLDEPTAELDGRAVRELAEMLERLPIARIVTSHDIGFLRRTVARALVLHEGRIAADGPAAEVLSNRELLRAARLE